MYPKTKSPLLVKIWPFCQCQLLERELEDQDSEELTPLINSEELTPLINSKSLTQHKISKKSILKSSNYKDPDLSKSNGCERSKLEVACE